MTKHLSILIILFIPFQIFAQTSSQLFNEAKDLRASGKDTKAIKKFEEALTKAEKEKNINLQMNIHLELAELKDNVVNYKDALNHYQSFSKLYKQQMSQKTKMLEDSVSGLQVKVDSSLTEIQNKENTIKTKENAIDSLTTEQLQSQLAIKDLELVNNQKELELQTSHNRRNLLLFIIAIIVLISVFIFRGYFQKRRGVRLLREKNYEIIKAKQKSDELLLNILPEPVAEELKEFGRTTPQKFDEATIMFTDFKGFTKYSEHYSPEELVKMVDHYFTAFDKIMAKYDIEKIKTIGDAYMCVSGIPNKNDKHAEKMIHAAFEMIEFVNKSAQEKKAKGIPHLEMRIGLHTGPIVAGVVGSRKFAYDVWGDAVNIAARMEQSGEPGKINISESVYALVSENFSFEFRGEIEAKNKGKLKMYFVKD